MVFFEIFGGEFRVLRQSQRADPTSPFRSNT